MDERLRVLLRQFMQTESPEDGLRFANESVRAGSELPEIWVQDWYEGSDNGSVIDIYYSKKTAYHFAAKFVENWLRKTFDADEPDEDLVELLEKIVALNHKGRHEAAVNMFNDEIIHRAARMNVYKKDFVEDRPQTKFKYPKPKQYRRNAVSRPSPNHFIHYKVFVVLALVGKQEEADAYIREHTSSIWKVAKYLQQTHSPEIKEIYRGMLLSTVPTDRIARAFRNHQYVSFSENSQVACWFASVDAILAEEAMEEHRNTTGRDATGWIGRLKPELHDILFHYTWMPLLETGPGPNIYEIARDLGAQLGESALLMEFRYHVRNQSEVLCQKDVVYSLQPVTEYACLSARELDNRYTPYYEFMVAPAGWPGVQAGQRMNIERSEYHRPRKVCSICGTESIEATRYLRGLSIIIDECLTCGYIPRFPS